MKRLQPVSRCPARGQDIAPEVKLTFVRDFIAATGGNAAVENGLTAIIPLFVNKDPSNPVAQ